MDETNNNLFTRFSVSDNHLPIFSISANNCLNWIRMLVLSLSSTLFLSPIQSQDMSVVFGKRSAGMEEEIASFIVFIHLIITSSMSQWLNAITWLLPWSLIVSQWLPCALCFDTALLIRHREMGGYGFYTPYEAKPRNAGHQLAKIARPLKIWKDNITPIRDNPLCYIYDLKFLAKYTRDCTSLTSLLETFPSRCLFLPPVRMSLFECTITLNKKIHSWNRLSN